jgi:hypothetical protein
MSFDVNFSTVEWPIWALWVSGLVVLVVGFLIGYFDSNLRSEKTIEAAETKAENLRVEAEKRLEEAKAMMEHAPKTVDDPGALRLKITKGVPMLEMDGAVVNMKTVTVDQKKRLIELLSLIRPWLEGGQPVSQPVSRPVEAMSTPQTPLQPASVQHTIPAARPSNTQPLPVPKSEEEKKFKALSMMAQIDTVLQARIAGTPLEGKISIGENPVSGIEVTVDREKYPGIDEVPDPEIKKAIRAAIAEWEQRYAPGA